MKNSSEILIKFGDRLRYFRKSQGLSQEQLAALAGLHRTYIGMLERAEKNVTLINLEKLAKAFDIPLGELVNL